MPIDVGFTVAGVESQMLSSCQCNDWFNPIQTFAYDTAQQMHKKQFSRKAY